MSQLLRTPLVTIVMATYNRALSLRQCSLSAIAELVYPNFEVVVVDDSSTDDTSEVLKTFQEKLKNLRILRNKTNQGASFSRNRGVAGANGEVIVFMDDDVSLFPDCLNELIKIYTETPETMAVWGGVYQRGNSATKHLKTFGSGSLWSVRRAVFDRLRFDTNMRYFGTPSCDEHEFARRIKQHGFKFVKAETVQADHFHGPAKNRRWRGIGGDLNHLYEQLKSGSIIEYYTQFILGIPLALKRLFGGKFDERTHQRCFKQVLYTPYRLLVFIKQREFSIALQWFFYVLVDIPLKAKTRGIVDLLARRYSSQWPA